MSLTADQQKAAHATASVAVTAGAGTGKTMMLAERYLFHIREQHLSPLEVVAVTFTEKASDELRSRIREEIAKSSESDSILAEVEAAQISTIHALAARICRDFYDLAGIPPDFVVLDETESPLFLAGMFEEAILNVVRPELIVELGYNWLASALLQLLKDPYAADRAFAHGRETWVYAVEEAKEQSLRDLISGYEWLEARRLFSRYRGAESDLLEANRRMAVAAMTAIETGDSIIEAAATIKELKANAGKKDNWLGADINEIKTAIRGLKTASAGCYALEGNSSVEDDQKLYQRFLLLREAFHQVSTFLSEGKLKEKVLDYNDLEKYALQVLKHPEAVAHYARRWQAFLVDEFQDTNPVQAEIMEQLTPNAALTIVGDLKQAIYGFRGADITVFRRLYENITKAGGEEVELSLSFRTHQPLVAKVNQVFQPILGSMHQELVAHRGDACNDEPCLSLHVVGEGEGRPAKFQQQIVEAEHIASEIKRMVSGGVLIHDKPTGLPRKAEYRDFAVLARTWAPLDTYLDSFAALGIPAVHGGGGSLLETREAKDAYALLSFLSDPADDISLAALLRSPFFAISDITLLEFARTITRGSSWWTALECCGEDLQRPREILRELLRESTRNLPSRLLRIADRLTGYTAVIANLVHGSRREADWRGFLELLRKLERRGRDDVFSIARHLRHLISSETEIERPPLDAADAVSLMTIHKSKGLEWPIIFIPDLARARNFGSEKLAIDPEIGVAFALEGPDDLPIEPDVFRLIKKRRRDREDEEAKRVLYVALTRARDRVVLTATKDKGPDIDLLSAGLTAAGISNIEIVYSDEKAIPPAPLPPDPMAIPESLQVEDVRIGLTDISVTSIATYGACPRRFWYSNVEGHPGLGEGSPRAGTVGTITHKALECDVHTVEELTTIYPVAEPELVNEALSLANRFRTDPCYATVRDAGALREIPITFIVHGVRVHGIADLVGDDFVLDFKTDALMDPEHHRSQLWAYASSLGKTRAYVAYLRHGELYEFEGGELEAAGSTTSFLLRGIAEGEYAATPGEKVCGYCRYADICDYRFDPFAARVIDMSRVGD
jgi:ATP-dependent helicase/nuclease subunit A